MTQTNTSKKELATGLGYAEQWRASQTSIPNRSCNAPGDAIRSSNEDGAGEYFHLEVEGSSAIPINMIWKGRVEVQVWVKKLECSEGRFGCHKVKLKVSGGVPPIIAGGVVRRNDCVHK